jgi:hypothetical protein
MTRFLAVLALAIPGTAHSFCGTYVGQAGASLYNNASQMVVVRQGNRTTLTMANDFEGGFSNFALVIPVPQVLSAADVALVDTTLIGRLDGYSGPRLVSYTCDDFVHRYMYDDYATQADTGASNSESDLNVTVEAEFSVGAYDFQVLSATGGGDGLVAWLLGNGYEISADASPLLQEYIDADQFFLAAQVSLEAVPDGATYLPPFRFGYDSAAFSLPIRLGTVNSPGEQDLILYALSDNGRIGISNYDEATLEDECMHDIPDADAFGVFYEAQFTAAVATTTTPKWLLEYGWSSASCDPCAEEPISDQEVQAFGFTGTAPEAYLSRIHMRYGPDDIAQDLVLYESGDSSSTQIRFIQYMEDLEEFLPVCGVGMVENGGECERSWDTNNGTDTGTYKEDGTGSPNWEDEDLEHETIAGCAATSGCGHTGALQFGALLVGLAIVVSTRRRNDALRCADVVLDSPRSPRH